MTAPSIAAIVSTTGTGSGKRLAFAGKQDKIRLYFELGDIK
jgi:hypothetical protein